MTRLIDIIAKLSDMDREDVICVRPEWSAESEAGVFRFGADYRVPEEAARLGLKYFLEVDVARQVLEEFTNRPTATLAERCARLIDYAERDA